MRADGRVVIALDGSPHSDDTLEWGLHEASLRGAAVLLARAWIDPHELVEWSWYPLLATDADTDALAYLAEKQDFAARLYPGLDVTTSAVRGREVPVLRTLSEAAQLLVVGAGGQGGQLRLGSVSGHLAAHARCDVVIVRVDAGAAAAVEAPVVVGIDGSSASLAAAETAAREASIRRAPLVVVHARPTVSDPFGRGMPAVSRQAATEINQDDPTHRAADDVAERLRSEHRDLEVRTALVDDDPAHALIVCSHDAALVVLGSRGLGAFRGMLLGSVSHDVVRDATSTVLVLHDGRPD